MPYTTTGVPSPVDRFFEFSLLGLLTSGYLAVVGSGYLDTPTIALTALALALRALLASGLLQWDIPQKVVAVATLGYMAFYPLDYQFLSKSFIPATVHLVFFIAIVKLLTARTNRDFFFVKVIAFLELLAACVLSSSFNFFLFLALFVLLGVATSMSSEIRSTAQKLPPLKLLSRNMGWRLFGAAATVSAGMLVLTGLLFFLLPRTARAALQHILPHHYHLAGFSNEINLGETGDIKKQDTPVMHIRFSAPIDDAGFLRWRGSALATFDGRRWYNLPKRGRSYRAESDGVVNLGEYRDRKSLSYVVHLNDPPPDGSLFFAGTPQSIRMDAPYVIRTVTDSYRLLGGSYTGLNYQAFSYLEPTSAEPEGLIAKPAPEDLTAAARDLFLELPAVDSRIFALARNVTALDRTPEGKARALEKYLRTKYSYTLELPQAEVPDPIADFLFRRRKGHCEYFASAMAVMLRTIGIPSRVATGFAGAQYNPVSGWYVVRASEAHSWVEAYLPRLGWTTFDPTPPDPNPPQLSFFTKIGFYFDAAEVFWQDWVLNYNVDRQLVLASRMEQSSRGFRTNWFEDLNSAATSFRVKASVAGSNFGAIGLTSVILALVLFRFGPGALRWLVLTRRFRKLKSGHASRLDATLLYERMLRCLKRRGIEKPAWLTPTEFAGVVQEPEMAVLVEDITASYNELRFGGKSDAAGRMIRLIGQLEALKT